MAFMREVEFETGGKVFKYPDLYMEFEINFKDDSEGNVGFISIYNLSRKSIDRIEKVAPATLRAGYEGDVGTLLPAVIEDVHTRYDRVDKETEIILGDHTKPWLNHSINQTWRPGITAQRVADDIIGQLPFDSPGIETSDDITYTKGKTFSTTSKFALEELARDIDAKLHVGRGTIYFRDKPDITSPSVFLSKDTGLISTPERGTKDEDTIWDVKCLLNYRIWADSVVQIESKSISGLYRVVDGQHILSGNDYMTEMEVVEYGA